MQQPNINPANDIFSYQYTLTKKDLNRAGSWDIGKVLMKINVLNSEVIQTNSGSISNDQLVNTRQHVDFLGQAYLGDAVEIASKETNRDNQYAYITVSVNKYRHNKKQLIAEGYFVVMINK